MRTELRGAVAPRGAAGPTPTAGAAFLGSVYLNGKKYVRTISLIS